jgi:hypothetical protein
MAVDKEMTDRLGGFACKKAQFTIRPPLFSGHGSNPILRRKLSKKEKS